MGFKEVHYNRLKQDYANLIEKLRRKTDKINDLTEQNKILKETVEFYGDKNSWLKQNQVNYTIIQPSDREGNHFVSIGGKRAREALRKIEAMKKGE